MESRIRFDTCKEAKMGRFIPLSIPNFEGNEEKYVGQAVKEGWVSTGGAFVSELEEKLSEFLHVPMTAACQSGTAAIHLALLECGVEPGDHVIVPTLTFIAAVNPVRYQFGEPIFMDCDDSLCIDPQKLEQFCREECHMDDNTLICNRTGHKIKAVIVVHIFGNLADMEAIMATAERYHLTVIEDATEALGTTVTTGKYQGKFAGTIGDYGAFSFNGNKIITTGGGGAVTARDKKAVQHMKYLSTQAKDDEHFYIHHEVGYNYRMTNLQGALGVAQMEELPEFIQRKRNNYQRYQKELEDLKKAELLLFREGTDPNYWFYSLILNLKECRVSLREVIDILQQQGIQTRAIWGLIHQQKPYQNFLAYRIEKAIWYGERVLNLPCSTNLTEEEIQIVAEALKKLLGGAV